MGNFKNNFYADKEKNENCFGYTMIDKHVGKIGTPARGAFFAMSGAVFSHIASGDSMSEIVPSLVFTNHDCGILVFKICGKKNHFS